VEKTKKKIKRKKKRIKANYISTRKNLPFVFCGKLNNSKKMGERVINAHKNLLNKSTLL
jgi:hypothetical protein